MDLTTIERIRPAHGRDDLVLAPGEAWLAGGSWLFSEPQPQLRGLVDLTTLGWPSIERTPSGGLSIGATCTLAELAAVGASDARRAQSLVVDCCRALLGSFKVWNVATVGGNLANSLPAGPMISLGAALDGVVVLWGPGGAERRMPVERFVTGVRRNALAAGEVIRALELPAHALDGRPAFRRQSLAVLGRSGALVTGRLDADGAFTLAVTAATEHPETRRFPGLPDAAELDTALDGIGSWLDDPHGAPDWREAVTRVLAREIVAELGRPAPEPAPDAPGVAA